MKTNYPTGSGKNKAYRISIGLLVAIAVMLPCLGAMAQSNVNLGTAGSFAVLAHSTVTSTGPTTLNGDLGLWDGTSVTETPAMTVNGTRYITVPVAAQAQNDLTTAYNDAAGRSATTSYGAIDLGGFVLTSGVYSAASTIGITGTLTLDAQGNPNAVWIFQVGSALSAEVNSSVVLTNGAQACNVFWQVTSSATLKTGAKFVGTIMALASVTLDTSATLDGRALARTGAVTLDSNTVGVPTACGPAILSGVPADTSASCDAIPAPPTVTASTPCSTQATPVVLSETILPGSCPNSYTLQRVWTATNACGDSVTSATQLIAVADTTAPNITCPQNVTIECSASTNPTNTGTATATDNCDTNPIIISFNDSTAQGNCPQASIITRTWSAVDHCANTSTCTQTITVEDTTPPDITCPQSPIVVSGNADCQGTVPDLRTQVQVSDNCDPSTLPVTQVPAGGTTFTGQTNVTLAVADHCGNTNSCTVTITTPCAVGFTIAKTLTNVYFYTGTTTRRPPLVGETMNFMITIVNTGAVTLGTVPVVDVYNTNLLRYVDATPPSDDNVDDGVINWTNVGPLAVGASTSIVANFIGVGTTMTLNPPVGMNSAVASPTTPLGILVLTNNDLFVINRPGAPTPVELKSFTANAVSGGILVQWETAGEFENLGYYIYRSETPEGLRTRINTEMIGGAGTSIGQAYEWLDRTANLAGNYYYWLEDVSWSFETKINGPAVVRGANEQLSSGVSSGMELGSFTPPEKMGLNRITYEELIAAGISIGALDPATLQVYVDNQEVAIFVKAYGNVMKPGDFILFYALEAGTGHTFEIRTGENAMRMEEIYAAPADGEGDVWYGFANSAGQLEFSTEGQYIRYLLAGFPQAMVYVLDVTDSIRPKLLYGYAWLNEGEKTGLYLSYFTEKPAQCVAIQGSAVIDAKKITTP